MTVAKLHFLAFLAALFVTLGPFSSASIMVGKPGGDDPCADCKANITKLAGFLVSDQVVEATMASFKRDLCPYYSSNDTKGCEKNVTLYWPSMAKALFGNADVPTEACQGLNKCNKSSTLSTWKLSGPSNNVNDDASCDSCIHFVGSVSKLMQANDTVKMATEFFNGPDFCAAAKPPLPKEDCMTFNGWFTPAAMSVLGQVMGLATQAVCQTGFGECH